MSIIYSKEQVRKFVSEVRKKNPYPDDIFIEPSKKDWKEITSFLKSKGFSPDAIFGSWGRDVWNNCCDEMVRELQDEQ